MHHIEKSISQSHTNTPLNRVNLNFRWTSINLGECKINIFWLPDGSPLRVGIDPVENLPTEFFVPVPARTAEFANFFVTLTIAGRNLATPTLDTTENQSLVDLLAYMKANRASNLHWGVTDQPMARNLQSLQPGIQTIDEECR